MALGARALPACLAVSLLFPLIPPSQISLRITKSSDTCPHVSPALTLYLLMKQEADQPWIQVLNLLTLWQPIEAPAGPGVSPCSGHQDGQGEHPPSPVTPSAQPGPHGLSLSSRLTGGRFQPSSLECLCKLHKCVQVRMGHTEGDHFYCQIQSRGFCTNGPN